MSAPNQLDRYLMWKKIHDDQDASFEKQQRDASEQYQREVEANHQRDDEAMHKICKEMNDFWNLPMGIACEIMQLVQIALPILVPTAIVLMMLNHASQR